MANETTYALISTLLPDVWEAALMYAQENFFMPSVVTTFSDQTGMTPRKSSVYAGGTVATGLGETDDLTAQAFTRSALATLTPQEIGTQFVITDRRVESDDVMSIIADMTQHVGYTVFKQVETHLAGLFASLTGGTISSAGTALTWQKVYNARALLAAKAIPGPYTVVLHEYQWNSLTTAVNIAATSNSSPLVIRDTIQSNYYVGSIENMNFFVTGDEVITAGTAVKGAIFNRQAIALDLRRALRIEPQRDASARHTEYNATMIYAYGVWRPTYGVQIISDASAPS